jgi:hypothetical protein
MQRIVAWLRFSIALGSIFLLGAGGEVGNLLNAGKYQEADGYCAEQPETAQKACYTQIGDAYLAKNEFDLAVKYYVKADTKVVFEENFVDNRHNWFEGDEKDASYNVQNGKYVFEQKRATGSWFSWPQDSSITLDPQQNFKIESTLTKIAGIDDNAYEIVWGVKDVNNCYKFGVDGNGYYVYSKFENGTWSALIDWTESPAIQKQNATNTLAVAKSGDKLQFSINGQVVNESPFQPFFGDTIGFSLNNNMRVEIKNLIVTQFPSAKDFYLNIAQTKLEQGEADAAAQCYQKAGLTEKEAYLKLVEASVAKGDYSAADTYLKTAGWSSQALNPVILLADEFDNNTNEWLEKDDDEALCKVQEGVYLFEHKRETGSWFTWNTVAIDPAGDFKIEATLTKLEGIEDNAYEIVWGLSDVNNNYKFGVSGNGSYVHSKWEQGTWSPILDWTQFPFIQQQNGTNNLSVVKSGAKLKFYINDHFVNEASYQPFFGDKVGFALNNKMKVAIEQITVTQLPPEVALTVAVKLHEKMEEREGLKTLAAAYLDRKAYDVAFEYFAKTGEQKAIVANYLEMLKAKRINAPGFVMALEKFGNKVLIAALKQSLSSIDEGLRNTAYLTMKRLKMEEEK